jgi:hypothetical protein
LDRERFAYDILTLGSRVLCCPDLELQYDGLMWQKKHIIGKASNVASASSNYSQLGCFTGQPQNVYPAIKHMYMSLGPKKSGNFGARKALGYQNGKGFDRLILTYRIAVLQ